MHWKASMFLLAMVMNFSVSTRSQGGEIQVQTGQMNIEHRQNGTTYIDTGRMQLSVPSNNRSRFRNYPRSNSSYRSTPRGCYGNRVVHQYNRQVNRSGHTSSHSSTSQYRCY